ncbi:DUF6602 domain-containing protein [Chryseolinea sp. T2]|uniref:DUF6602 domain-containing protein n=1 Tax=Chryseolinea sp. T2 TaxID=3129255 RepID=UPI00307725AA
MSLLEYHQATTHELLAVTHKVRNLIHHWGEDGRYKEAILKNVLRRFIPERYLIATGFVVKPTFTRGEHVSSRQIDIIIYDSTSPVLFKEGDFVILTPDGVRAIVEVKNNLQTQDLARIIHRANENGKFVFLGKTKMDQTLNFFNGVFAYEGYQFNASFNSFSKTFSEGNDEYVQDDNYSKFKVNHVSLNKDWFIKYWPDDQLPHSVYRINDLSFPFFISNLTNYLANKSVTKNNFVWFVTDKELNLEHQF